jgi:hypothetical protein
VEEGTDSVTESRDAPAKTEGTLKRAERCGERVRGPFRSTRRHAHSLAIRMQAMQTQTRKTGTKSVSKEVVCEQRRKRRWRSQVLVIGDGKRATKKKTATDRARIAQLARQSCHSGCMRLEVQKFLPRLPVRLHLTAIIQQCRRTRSPGQRRKL